MPLSKEDITQWLDNIRKDREWLATQMRTSKRTVDSWFSTRGFTPQALAQIERLMRETGPSPDGKFRVSFDVEEFERIEAARLLLGSPPRSSFYHDAIIDFADRVLQSESESKITAHPSLTEMGDKDEHRRDQSA